MRLIIASVMVVLTLQCVQAQGDGISAPALLSIGPSAIDNIREAGRGQVLLLNFWATWCKPCIEEFPDLVKLHQMYKANGLNVTFISIDDDDMKTRKKVAGFLRKMNVSTTSYIKKGGNDEAFINAVHPKWSGGLPATLIYDANGNLVMLKVEESSFAELEKIVVPLLKN